MSALLKPKPGSAGLAGSQKDSAEALLRRLEWKVIKRLDGMLQGDYRSLFRGFGLDLADLREYQASDDVRFIDWNVTARMNTPYVREFQEDRAVSAWFLMDLSPSIDFASITRSKRRVATEFVAVLSKILTRHGNKVGAALYGAGVSAGAKSTALGRLDALIPARHGRRQVLHLIDAIGQSSRSSAGLRLVGKNAPPQTENLTDLSKLLEAASKNLKRRSLVFVVSDFISKDGWTKALSHLAQRHEVLAVQVYDPAESELPEIGLVTLTDSETGEQVLVDSNDPKLRKRFGEAIAQREEALQKAFVRSGVDCLALSTQDDLVDALVGFSAMRKRYA